MRSRLRMACTALVLLPLVFHSNEQGWGCFTPSVHQALGRGDPHYRGTTVVCCQDGATTYAKTAPTASPCPLVHRRALCSRLENFENLRRPNDGSAVEIGNPATAEFEVRREG